MKKKILLFMSTILCLTMLLAACGSKEETPAADNNTGTQDKTDASNTADDSSEDDSNSSEVKTLKVGFIYVGPIGDGGYTYAQDQGRLYLEDHVDHVETMYVENVPEGPEVEKVMRDMIDEGVGAIFATSFGYMDYVANVAKEYPDVKFFHCSGYLSSDNMVNYFGRIYQARYLSGIVAGLKTETNKIGYVGAYEIPEVIRGINAFTLGARSVNPDVEVDVRWTHTWYDPALEKQAAIALLDEGADVIAQHQDTAGPQQAAQEKGKWSIGYNTDMTSMAPDAHMTSAIWNWGPYFVDQVNKILDGTWTAENYWGNMSDGVVALSPLTKNAPEEAAAKVEEIKKAIEDGSLEVFGGPIKDQDGTIRVEEGSVLTDEEMLNLDWLVEGVVGKLPEE